MQQGQSGSWQFTLPFTANQGGGSYLFLFYLFLGHLSRWTGLSLIVVYHLARVIGVVWLAYLVRNYMHKLFGQSSTTALYATILALFGSGLGFLVLPFGYLTSDFVTPEAYPFLSALTNPHFPISIAMMLSLFLLSTGESNYQNNFLLFFLAVALALIQPFGVVIVLLVCAFNTLWTWWVGAGLNLVPVVEISLGGLPIMLYQATVVLTDRNLYIWNSQNQTPSPPLWDVILSLSPAVLLGFGAVIFSLREKLPNGIQRITILWLVLGLLFVYLPFNLQRRFLLGLYVPASALAVFAIAALHSRGKVRFSRRILPVLMTLSFGSNLIFLAILGTGISQRSPTYYLSSTESEALEWLGDAAPPQSVILASPESSILIPEITGLRIVYAHPYETVNAAENETSVMDFYTGRMTYEQSLDFLNEKSVDYVLFGPRERAIGEPQVLGTFLLLYQKDDIAIYTIPEQLP
jgi:hypothetical protein